MKRFFIFSLLISFMRLQGVYAEVTTQEDLSRIEKQCNILKGDVSRLQQTSRKDAAEISKLSKENNSLQQKVDSLSAELASLRGDQSKDRTNFTTELGKTNSDVAAGQASMQQRSLIGVALFVVALIIIAMYLWLRKRKDTDTIDSVRKVQDTLEAAQKKLQEDSVSLDNKLMAILEKQMAAVPQKNDDKAKPDHSLALKVADEIVRMETNLSRMDETIKGYKQLKKAVERICDNFLANGYEIVEMLGKPYKEGMKAAVTFVTDENLEDGKKIISKIIKPQVNYKDEMIQAAQIEVSQPE